MSVGEFQPDLRPLWTTTTPPEPALAGGGVQAMSPQATQHQLPWPGDKTCSQIAAQTWFSMSKGWLDDTVSGHIWFIGTNPDATPSYLGGGDFTLKQDVRTYWALPPGTDKVSVALNPHLHPVGWCFEVKGQ